MLPGSVSEPPSLCGRWRRCWKPDQVTNATLVLGSHDHDDHIDRRAWPAIAQAAPGAKFVVPELLREKIVRDLGLPAERVLGMDEGISVREMGITITAIPAAHESLDEDPATGRHPYLGYILPGKGFRLYHAGDTCIYEGMQAKLRRGPLDLAIAADQRAGRAAAGRRLHRQHDVPGSGRPGGRRSGPG